MLRFKNSSEIATFTAKLCNLQCFCDPNRTFSTPAMRNGGWQVARRVNYNAFEMPVSQTCGVRYILVLKKAASRCPSKKVAKSILLQ
jgi:hypothetical protein